MRASSSTSRQLQLASLVLLSALLVSLIPQPLARHLPPPLQASPAVAAEAAEAGRGVEPATSGSLRFAAEVDADGDPRTNPVSSISVPVERIGAPDALLPVFYTTVVLAAEVVPDQSSQNPAGTHVTFRLWNESGTVVQTRETIADAWGAAFVDILLDDLHLAGRFSYTAQALGFAATPIRSFTVDPRTLSSDTRLGAAALTTAVEADGRIVMNIGSPLPLDASDLAAEISAVRLKPATTPGAEPEHEVLPPLVARRVDDHHARAELYLDEGDYLLTANAASEKVTLVSMPRLVHVPAGRVPPIATVERITDVDEAGQTGLVQYRTPGGDVAVKRRVLAGLPEVAPESTNPGVFQQQRRLGAFAWRTDTYKLTTTRSADADIRASLESFSYDPLLRRYDIKIESRLPQPVNDQLTVDVLGPNGVTIYRQTTPIVLEAGTPLYQTITVPTDRGEPHGIRVNLHGPLQLEATAAQRPLTDQIHVSDVDTPGDLGWLVQPLGDALSSTFGALAGFASNHLSLNGGLKGELKVLEIKLLTAT